MNSKIAVAVGLAAVLAVMLVPVSFSPAFAADVAVSIVSGASSKSTDAFSPSPVTANVGDTVTWTNKDTTPHTVTSGTDGKADGKFNSSPNFTPVIASQKTYTVKFNETGDYPYFCELHPNMVGMVKIAGGSTGGGPAATTVTAKTSDGQSFSVTSTSTTSKVTTATIQEGQSVTVTFDKAGEVQLTLPTKMISGINSVTAGGQTVNFTPVNATTIKSTVPASSTTVVIKGATVVPEFSVIAVLVLAISIAALVGYTRFAKNSGIGFFGRT